MAKEVHFDTVREIVLTRDKIAELIASSEAMNMCRRSGISLELLKPENIDYMFKTTTYEFGNSSFSSLLTPSELLVANLLEKEDRMLVVHLFSAYLQTVRNCFRKYHTIRMEGSPIEARERMSSLVLEKCIVPYLSDLRIGKNDLNVLNHYLFGHALNYDLIALSRKESSFPQSFYFVEVKAQRSRGGPWGLPKRLVEETLSKEIPLLLVQVLILSNNRIDLTYRLPRLAV